MNAEPPNGWCLWPFNESSIPPSHISKATADKWAELHIKQEITSLRDLQNNKSSWLFLRLAVHTHFSKCPNKFLNSYEYINNSFFYLIFLCIVSKWNKSNQKTPTTNKQKIHLKKSSVNARTCEQQGHFTFTSLFSQNLNQSSNYLRLKTYHLCTLTQESKPSQNDCNII